MQQTETEALARAVAGDVDAFASVVRRHHRTLYYYVVGKLSDEAEAEDVVQKTFVTAYQRLREFDLRQPLLAWLRGIALNHCRNELRMAARAARMKERLLDARRAELRLSLLDEGSDERRVGALRKCVQGLAEEERMAVRLRFVEEVPLPAIGRALARTGEAARLLLFRIRARLAQCVKRRVAAEGDA